MINPKTPSLLLACLVLIIFIIVYNYWKLSDENYILKERLFVTEEKWNDLKDLYAKIDKQNEANLNKIKAFEQNAQSNAEILKKKDSEFDELNGSLKKKILINDQLLIDLKETKEKLSECTNTSEKNGIELKTESDKIKKNLTDLTSKYDILMSQYLACNKSQTSQSVVEVKANSNTKEPTKTVSFTNIVELDDLICLLPKVEGTCENRTERYYFDSKTQTCSTFVYSCDGNLNNFDTKEQCEKVCLSQKEITLSNEQQNSSTATSTISTTTQGVLTPIDPNDQEN